MQLVAREGLLAVMLEEMEWPTDNHKAIIQLMYDETLAEMKNLGLQEVVDEEEENLDEYLKKIHKEITSTYPSLFGNYGYELEVKAGKEKSLRYRESIIAINDTKDIIEFTLVTDADVHWAKTILDLLARDKDYIKNLIDDKSFEDRKSINERYGFSN